MLACGARACGARGRRKGMCVCVWRWWAVRCKGPHLLTYLLTYLDLHPQQRLQHHQRPSARTPRALAARSPLRARPRAPTRPYLSQGGLRKACGERQRPASQLQPRTRAQRLCATAARPVQDWTREREVEREVRARGRGTPRPLLSTPGSLNAAARCGSRTCNTPGQLRPV